jgi:hypothetical protein
MKTCTLKKKPCRYVKDGKDYRDLKNRIICSLSAMLEVKGIFDLNKMTKCPLREG